VEEQQLVGKKDFKFGVIKNVKRVKLKVKIRCVTLGAINP